MIRVTILIGFFADVSGMFIFMDIDELVLKNP